jgi:hypothetical protein
LSSELEVAMASDPSDGVAASVGKVAAYFAS